MPNVNGFDVLNFFETDNLFVTIPVAIITADDSKETLKKVLNYPITDVIQKPFNERDIKRVIDKMIG
jgi:CheY-like chemotaxis protein